MTNKDRKDIVIEIIVFFLTCVFMEFVGDLIFDNLKYDDAANFIGAGLGEVLLSTVLALIATGIRMIWRKERKLDFFLTALWVSSFILYVYGILIRTEYTLSAYLLVSLVVPLVGFPFCSSRITSNQPSNNSTMHTLSPTMKKKFLIVIEIAAMIASLMLCEYMVISRYREVYLNQSIPMPKGFGAYLGTILPSFLMAIVLGAATMGIRCIWKKDNKLNAFLTASWMWGILSAYLLVAWSPALQKEHLSASTLPILPVIAFAITFICLREKKPLFHLSNAVLPNEAQSAAMAEESASIAEDDTEKASLTPIENTKPYKNLEELKNLTNLYSKGLITEEEFLRLKEDIKEQ